MNNHKQQARFKELDKEQDKFINARITTPQTYDEIKGKGQATILKIASKGIVEKLLKRCEYYKAIITKKTETIKSKNELIGLLAGRLQNHEPDLFKNDFKEQAEAVEQAKTEKVEAEKQPKTEITDQEKAEVKLDNEKHEKETDPDNLEDDPEPNDPEEPEDLCGGEPNSPECGEGGETDDIEIDDEEKDKEDKDDETPED